MRCDHKFEDAVEKPVSDCDVVSSEAYDVQRFVSSLINDACPFSLSNVEMNLI